MTAAACLLHNGQAAPVAAVPRLSWEDFQERIVSGTHHGGRLVAFFGQPTGDSADNGIRLWAVLARPGEGGLTVMTT